MDENNRGHSLEGLMKLMFCTDVKSMKIFVICQNIN